MGRGGYSSRTRDGSGDRRRETKRFRRPLSAAAIAALTAVCALAPTAGASVPAEGSGFTPRALGLVPTPQAAPSAATVGHVKAAATALPASVDLTPNAMPVGDQGQVGSCAAWATDYGALGYWVNAEKLRGGGLEPMYTYAQYVSAFDGGQDRGSSIDYHLQVAEQQGVDNQSDYSQGNFDYSDLPTQAEHLNAVNWKLSTYSDLAIQPSASSTLNQQSIETALAAGNPIVIGIPVYWSFELIGSANNGFYSGPTSNDPFLGNHAIVALGYSSQGLVIQNSWGTSWGHAGYATLSWSFVNQYVFQATSVGKLVAGQPVNTAAPSIGGNVAQGTALTATTGSWSPSGTSYAYQWERAAVGSNAWSVISGATSAGYTPQSADIGDNLRVLVTATNSIGQGAAPSAGVGPVPTLAPKNTAVPAITGTPVQGQALSASTGTWSPVGTSYAYQWQRSTNAGSTWSAISGATTSSYTPGTADLGVSVRVVVTASNSYGQAAANSATVGPVASGAPVNKALPSVTGTPIEGGTLTASTGTWSPAGTTYAYQWQRLMSGQWANVSGMTKATYQLEPSDVGTSVRVQITATNAYGYLYAWSAASATVKSAAPVNTVAPVVSGSATRGATLTASTGTWTNPGTAYAYQWQRSGSTSGSWVNIADARRSTYTLTTADEGARLRVQVSTATQWGLATASSAATGKVLASPPVNTVAPVITGSAKVGGVLTASVGTWSGSGNSYSYQWQRSTAQGYVAIKGATTATYKAMTADQGAQLRVLVTAVNPDGTASRVSNSTSAVPSH